ncbi:MAG: hypothetical protein R3C42_00365 [Parvularculaceae bacterium]
MTSVIESNFLGGRLAVSSDNGALARSITRRWRAFAALGASGRIWAIFALFFRSTVITAARAPVTETA